MVLTILLFVIRSFSDGFLLEENAYTGIIGEGKNQQEKEKVDSEEISDKGQPVVSERWRMILPYDGNVEDLGKTFTLEKIADTEHGGRGFLLECCVNQAQFTKAAPNTDAMYYVSRDADSPIVFDEEYNIENDYTYVVVNVTVKNLSENLQDFNMTSFVLFVIDPVKGDVYDCEYSMARELRGYKNRDDAWKYDKDYGKIKMNPGEEFTWNLVYIEKDSDIDRRDIYIKFWPHKETMAGDVNSRYIKIND